MKHRIIISIIFFFILISIRADARLFFVGSNPHLSKIAFPQDILFFKKDFVAYTIDYEYLPSWGDVDEFTKKPNNSYASSSDDMTFPLSDGDTGVSTFKTDGEVDIYQNSIDYLHIWNKNLNTLFSLKYKTLSMESSTSGNLRATNDVGAIEYVPFDYNASSETSLIYLQGSVGWKIGSVPVGFKLGIGRERSKEPESELKAYANGTYIKSDRLLWGWTTTGCNHIFGYRSINGDAWYQNDYSFGTIYQYDLQLAATFESVKIGVRYRARNGILDNNVWVSCSEVDEETASIEEVLNSRFCGKYLNRTWSKEVDESNKRIYANVTFKKSKSYKLNTLFFLGHDRYTYTNVHSENNEISNDVKEKFNGYIIEANPNVNLFLAGGVVIDAAILLEYSWSDFKNTYRRWNGQAGGSKETYWNTSVYAGEEQSWEEFSYADEDFFDFGWEIDISVPLYKSNKHQLFLIAMLFHNNKFTVIEKIYGSNIDTPYDISFNMTNKRINTKKEMWLNSIVSLFYKRDRLFFWLSYTEPLIYSIDFKTRVENSFGYTQYESRKKMQTAIQEKAKISHPTVLGGPKISFMVGCEL